MHLEQEGPQARAEELPLALEQEALMGEVRTRPVCTEHGPMSWDASEAGIWVCTGFSGEGCLAGMCVTDEQARAMTPLPCVAYERSAA